MPDRISFLILIFISLFLSCQSPTNQPGSYTLQTDSISAIRNEVKTAPVASFRVKTDNPLNNWYFLVNLYETKNRFDFAVKMQFEELTGEDTIHIPNLGMEPKLVIQKGTEKYSCIIGFLDRAGTFFPYKEVMVKDGKSINLTTLHRYTLTSSEKTN